MHIYISRLTYVTFLERLNLAVSWKLFVIVIVDISIGVAESSLAVGFTSAVVRDSACVL